MLFNRDNSTDLSSHVSQKPQSLPSEASSFDSDVQLSTNNYHSDCSEDPPDVGGDNIAGLMCRAYGAPLLSSAGSPTDSPWIRRWTTIIHHSGHHYLLPGGSIGRKYVELLNQELQYFVISNTNGPFLPYYMQI